MLYAILAYHEEAVVTSWSPDEDAALMVELHKVHDRLHDEGKLGPAARLGATADAFTLRTKGGKEVVIDGPFAETKDLVAGYWLWDVKDMDEAVAWVKRCPNPMPGPSEIEIRPVYEMSDWQ